MTTRIFTRLLLSALLMLLALAPFASAAEWGMNRAGGDYKNFPLAADQPSLCEQACNSEGQCKAWTFVRPGVQASSAICWLKSSVPAATPDDCCVSGFKQISAGSFENNRDRAGMDYKNFDLAAANPQLCETACENEGQCRAWTYVKPGLQGPAPRCWLKSGVPAAVVNNCCVSGVK